MRMKLINYLKKTSRFAYINLALCVLGMFLANKTFVNIDATARTAFLLLAFCSGKWLGNHANEIRNMKVKKWKKFVFILLCLYTSFSLVGNACFVYPLAMHVSVYQWIQYIVTFLWITPVLVCICYKMVNCQKSLCEKQPVSSKTLLVVGIVYCIIAIIYLIAYNPCIGTYDSVYAMKLAATTGAVGMEDITPPFYIMWLQAILNVWKSPYAVVIVQLFWFLLLFYRVIYLFFNKGMTNKDLWIGLLFIGLSVNIMIFLITIWKDIPYALSILWLTIVLIQLQMEEPKWYVYIELVASLVGTYFFRQNGVVPFVLTCFVLCIVVRKYKVWFTVFLAIILVFFIKNPVYNFLDIDREQAGVPYVGLGLDVVGVYYNNGNLSEDARKLITQMIPNPETYDEYTPYTLKTIQFDLDVTTKEFIKIYIDTFINNPKLVLRGFLCRNDGIWDLFQGIGGHYLGATITGAAEDADPEWLSYFSGREKNILTDKLNSIIAYMVWKDLSGVFLGRTGIWTLILLVCMFVLACKKQYNYMVVLVPCVGQIISLALSSGWANYRYMIPMEFMSALILGLTLLLENRADKREKE